MQQSCRLTTLDGLRGIAAIAVTFMHFHEPFQMELVNNWLPHAYLAVDFFFCLSGFVMAYAYGSPRSDLGTGELIKRRLIRLHPLVVIAMLLGLAVAIVAETYNPTPPTAPWYVSPGQRALQVLAGLVLLPTYVFTGSNGAAYPLAAQTWSLLCEYVGSLIFAVGLRRLPTRWLIALLVPATVALVLTAHAKEHLDGGFTNATLWIGMVRMAFSFLTGMVLFRIGRHPVLPLAWAWLPILLVASFLIPFNFLVGIYDLLAIMILFPLIVWIGAAANPGGTIDRVNEWLGELSYPLYMTHYALVLMVFARLISDRRQPELALLTVPLMTLAAIAFAFVIGRYVDRPIRTALSGYRADRGRAPGEG